MSELIKNCVIGYSGHAYVVIEAASQAGLSIVYYADVKEVKNNPYQLIYLGNESDADFKGNAMPIDFILGIGDNKLRRKIAEKVLSLNRQILTVIHPSTQISQTAVIGTGTFISSGVAINALSQIGRFCVLNTSCIVEHECVLGDAVHIAPSAVLAGNVIVGENTFVGANAVVKQGVKIGRNVIIGAGSVVIRDIEDGATYAGNPARRIK